MFQEIHFIEGQAFESAIEMVCSFKNEEIIHVLVHQLYFSQN